MNHLVNMPIEPNGYFMAEAVSVGTTPEELNEIERGAVSPARFGVIMDNLKCAAHTLIYVEPAGRC